jgi:hypothetical protein
MLWKMKMKRNGLQLLIAAGMGLLLWPMTLAAQPSPALQSSTLVLDQAVMCEAIESFYPKNIGLIFSMGRGKVVCFTSFKEISKETVIYHDWYRRDQLSTRRKLTLKPPRWSSFTEIQLRETDKGPWRVDVVDEDGQTIHTLRFSITD